MSADLSKKSKRAANDQSNPKKRKYRAPDSSKHPTTITTAESVDKLIDSLYDAKSIGENDRLKVRQCAEEFTRILVDSVLQSAHAARSAEAIGTSGKVKRGHVQRVGAEEIWKAFVQHEILRPFAFRFLELGLIPPEFDGLFGYQGASNDEMVAEDPAMVEEESEESDSDDFHPFLAEE